jgi:hypothetical protein
MLSGTHRHRHGLPINGMVAVSEAHAAHRHRPPPDEGYLTALAERMADVLDLPLATARKRVMALAVSARPRPEH